MRLTKRLIAIQPASRAKAVDDARCCFEALALGIVDDPCPIAAAMHAGRNPSRCCAGEFRRFNKKVDKGLLPSFGHGKYVDLGDDACFGVDDRHVSIPRRLRRDGTDRSTYQE